MKDLVPLASVVAHPAHGRVYVTQAWVRGGTADPADVGLWVADQRIRQFAIERFSAAFGKPPGFTWCEDGHAAECWGDDGSRLHVRQINDR